MITPDPIIVKVNIDAPLFRQFSYFNHYKKNRTATKLSIFTLILVVTGLALIPLVDLRLGLGVMLLGVIYPIVSFVFFSWQINNQIIENQLKNGKDVYQCDFSPARMKVSDLQGMSIEFEWDQLYGIFEVNTCFYIYAVRTKAYLIPKNCLDNADKFKQMFLKYLPADRYFDRRN